MRVLAVKLQVQQNGHPLFELYCEQAQSHLAIPPGNQLLQWYKPVQYE